MVALCVLAAIAALVPAPASAASRIYWSNYLTNGLAYWDLDGTGGANIDTAGTTVDGPMGMALDPAHGRVYWTNWGSDMVSGTGLGTTISYANLDGSGAGGTLPIAPGFVNGPHGLAIDPAAGKLYWPNFATSTIASANLDGSGAANLNTTGATVDGPRGVAVDPAAGRIYWANYDSGTGTTISYANLNGTGGDDLMTDGATVDGPEGVALDTGAGRIYWGNYGLPSTGDTIAYANLDGSGGAQDLPTPGVTPVRVHGVALDPAAGEIFWPNFGADTLAVAQLDGSGASEIPVDDQQADVFGPVLPTLLDKPQPTAPPTISGTPELGSTLTCAQGSWAPDLVAALLYRAPQSFSYGWTLDGQPFAGETSTSIIASSAGTYRCRETAENAAGDSSQLSEAFVVPANAFLLGELRLNRRRGTGRLEVTVPGPGTLELREGGKLKPVLEDVDGGSRWLPIRPRGKTAKALRQRGSVRVDPAITFTPTGGFPRTKHDPLKLKEKPAA